MKKHDLFPYLVMAVAFACLLWGVTHPTPLMP